MLERRSLKPIYDQAEVGQTPEFDIPFWTNLVTMFSTDGDQLELSASTSTEGAVVTELVPDTRPVAATARVTVKITAAYLFMIPF